jgi:hypothetical protein
VSILDVLFVALLGPFVGPVVLGKHASRSIRESGMHDSMSSQTLFVKQLPPEARFLLVAMIVYNVGFEGCPASLHEMYTAYRSYKSEMALDCILQDQMRALVDNLVFFNFLTPYGGGSRGGLGHVYGKVLRY